MEKLSEPICEIKIFRIYFSVGAGKMIYPLGVLLPLRLVSVSVWVSCDLHFSGGPVLTLFAALGFPKPCL